MEVSSHALACTASTAPASRSPSSRTSAATTSTSTGRWSATSRPRRACSRPALAARAVVNLDDPHGRLLLDAAEIPTVAVLARRRVADLRPRGVRQPVHLARASESPCRSAGASTSPTPSAAATAAAELGVPIPDGRGGHRRRWTGARAVRAVDEGQPFPVVVDYAHTPDGLEQVLEAAREVAAGHACCVVFGAGGDRDRTKRPAMGAAAAAGAPTSWCVTSDNPRSEDPAAIIAEIVTGVTDSVAASWSSPTGGAPSRSALERRGAGDVVVIAGKGHETTQTTGDVGGAVRRPRRRPRGAARLGGERS